MLSQQQRDEFSDNGFTRIRLALPGQVRSAMVDRIWRALAERQGIRRNESINWIEGGVRGIGDLKPGTRQDLANL